MPFSLTNKYPMQALFTLPTQSNNVRYEMLSHCSHHATLAHHVDILLISKAHLAHHIDILLIQKVHSAHQVDILLIQKVHSAHQVDILLIQKAYRLTCHHRLKQIHTRVFLRKLVHNAHVHLIHVIEHVN